MVWYLCVIRVGGSLAWSDGDGYPGPGVVDVAPRVPQVFGVFGLAGGAGVPGAGDDLGRPAGKVDGRLPQSPGPGPRVGAEVCLLPVAAAVDGDVDPGDGAVLAGVRVPADPIR